MAGFGSSAAEFYNSSITALISRCSKGQALGQNNEIALT